MGSGRGSNARSIHSHLQSVQADLQISIVISNRPDAGILDFAASQGIPTSVYQPNSDPDGDDLIAMVRNSGADWIVLAGYLKAIPVPVIDTFKHRILNIHPALLPSFGGQGMYGMNVHEAVYAAGVKVTGATVHLVTKDYDAGPIIAQRAVHLTGDESPKEIADAVLKIEHQLYPEVLLTICNHGLRLDGNRVWLEKEMVNETARSH